MDKSGASGGSTAERDYNEPVATRSETGGCSPSYVKTLPGILKMAETALSIAALICGVISLGSAGGWGTFVAGCSLAACIVLLLLHLTGFIARMPFNSPLSFFGLAACGTYVADAVLQFNVIRGGLGFTRSSRQPQQGAQRQEPERY